MNSRAGVTALLASGLVLAVGFVVDARTAAAAYLVAWIAWSAVPIGALGLFMTSYLVRRAWTEALFPIFAATMSLFPVVALAFVPVLLSTREIYPATADPAALPTFKAQYFAFWFFLLRAVLYIAVWIALAGWLRRTWRDDAGMVHAASIGSIVYALTVSLAGIDWLESLDPDFHSSIYGLLYISFVLLNGAGFVIGVGLLSPRQIGRSRGYSGLLLSLILFWAYLHAMQYIVIWSGNIPKEVTWYLARSENGWQLVLTALAFGQLALPFFLLLSATVRSDPHWLLTLCGLTLAMRWLEAALLILPALSGLSPGLTAVMTAAALLFVGTLFWLTFHRASARVGLSISGSWRPIRAEAAGRQAG